MERDILDDWYTAAKAADALAKKSGRRVRPDYLRSLAREGKITTKKIGERMTLYRKSDVDAYVVEPRGAKVARAQKARFGKSAAKKPAAKPSPPKDDDPEPEELTPEWYAWRKQMFAQQGAAS